MGGESGERGDIDVTWGRMNPENDWDEADEVK